LVQDSKLRKLNSKKYKQGLKDTRIGYNKTRIQGFKDTRIE